MAINREVNFMAIFKDRMPVHLADFCTPSFLSSVPTTSHLQTFHLFLLLIGKWNTKVLIINLFFYICKFSWKIFRSSQYFKPGKKNIKKIYLTLPNFLPPFLSQYKDIHMHSTVIYIKNVPTDSCIEHLVVASFRGD